MTAPERSALAAQLANMRRRHADLRRAARDRTEVAEFMAAHDPAVAVASVRKAMEYTHAAGEIRKDIAYWERQAFAEMVVDMGRED